DQTSDRMAIEEGHRLTGDMLEQIFAQPGDDALSRSLHQVRLQVGQDHTHDGKQEVNHADHDKLARTADIEQHAVVNYNLHQIRLKQIGGYCEHRTGEYSQESEPVRPGICEHRL